MSSSLDLLFAELKLPVINKAQALAELDLVDKNLWYFNRYRNTWMLPIMTASGGSGEPSVQDMRPKQPDFQWTSYAPVTIKNYLEEHVFTWMKPRPRVVILRTPKGSRNNEHIDCSPTEFGTLQHKFRMVLQGRTDSLYFITRDGNVFVPETEHPFIIDGSWPHGMENNFPADKITLCIGTPWSGAETYPDLGLTVHKSKFTLPSDVPKYFDKRFF